MRSDKKVIELLAPAKNVECARQAILHGADAVYIGAPRFGARASAGNSIDELAELVQFAHTYYVRIYVTVNTILYDSELQEVSQLIWDLWRIGVDALIVQDFAITRLNLPPIPLHASTQMDNRTPEKLKFIEQCGFRQAVLARELSLKQIREISDNTDIRLEAFVHGALCVSYSGQCYLSYALSGRSANRGVCAQYCRLPYDLIDSKGAVLARHKYLLSLKDLSRSKEELEQMIEAGVTSFKIEGRLKDVSYCKNVTAWYRKQLDSLMETHPNWSRSSSGRESLRFEPALEKSFNRSFTSYFLHGRKEIVHNPDTPKSMGEQVGFVRAQKLQHFVFLGGTSLHNGDGLSFFDENGQFDGFRVNRVEDNRVYPADPKLKLRTGIRLFRTYDKDFEQSMAKNTSLRVISVEVKCWELSWGFALQMSDQEGHRSAISFECEKTLALKPQNQVVEQLLSKLPMPEFQVVACQLEWSGDYFIPLSQWTLQRNRLFEAFIRTRHIQYPKQEMVMRPSDHPFPEKSLSYLGNVLNSEAVSFYRQHGVGQIEPALESLSPPAATSRPDLSGLISDGALELMRCKHCIRYALNACPRQKGVRRLEEPLFLSYNGEKLQLGFDCRRCEMTVLYSGR